MSFCFGVSCVYTVGLLARSTHIWLHTKLHTGPQSQTQAYENVVESQVLGAAHPVPHGGLVGFGRGAPGPSIFLKWY